MASNPTPESLRAAERIYREVTWLPPPTRNELETMMIRPDFTPLATLIDAEYAALREKLERIAEAAAAYREADVQAINGVTPKYVAKNAKSRLFAALEGKGDAVVEQQGETGNG